MSSKHEYTKPVSGLLSYGNCLEMNKKSRDWPNYVEELGFDQTHIDQLMDMALDPDLNWADSNSLEVWAPVHAWRALGQLKAGAAVKPLLGLLDDLGLDNDWAHEELPEVLAMIGEPALEQVTQYLQDRSKDLYARAAMAKCLMSIAKRIPEQRDSCIATILGLLRAKNPRFRTLNGFLIADLLNMHRDGIIDLNDHADVIGQAFKAEAVDYTVVGDWEDVQIELGRLDKRVTPARNYFAEEYFGIDPAESGGYTGDRLLRQALEPRSKTVVKPPKIGRNDPCPCGSGKKYKKCCLLKQSA